MAINRYLSAIWAALSYPVIIAKQKLGKAVNAWADKREVAVMQGGIKVTQGMAKAWKCYLCDEYLEVDQALTKLWSSYPRPAGIANMSPESVAEGITRASIIAFGGRVTDDGRWYMTQDNPFFGYLARRAAAINPTQIRQDAIKRGKELHADLFKLKDTEKVAPVEGVSIGGDTI